MLVLLLAACCGGGKSATPTPLPTPTCLAGWPELLSDVSEDDIALMALPRTELGRDYARMSPDDFVSGYQTNDSVLAWEPSEEQPNDVERFGRINGYQEAYQDVQAAYEHKGASYIATGVSRYREQDGASGDLRDQVGDVNRQALEEYVRPTVEEFTPNVGDESTGIIIHGNREAGYPYHYDVFTVTFRRGCLLGYVEITRQDGKDVRDEATGLALKLDARIHAALCGQVLPPATPTPGPTWTPAPPTATTTPRVGLPPPSGALTSFRYLFAILVEADMGAESATVAGEFLAPDSLRCEISGSTSEFREELVLIGDEAWIDTGDGFQTASVHDADVEELLEACPGSPLFWEDLDIQRELAALRGERDNLNGVACRRYAIADVKGILQAFGFGKEEAAALSIRSASLWLAEDGGWPVALRLELSGDADVLRGAIGMPREEAEGKAGLTMRIEISDVSSPSISIEPPESE